MAATVLFFPALEELASEQLKGWWRTLSADDRGRADGFGSARRSRQFIVGRYLLAYLIRERLDVDPVISTAENGAPRVDGVALHCSIAHSGAGVVVGIDGEHALGVDMEHMKLRRFDTLSAGYFHPSEVAALIAMPPTRKREAFYRLWTRKEAVAKAGGGGLTLARLAQANAGQADGFTLHTVRMGDFMISVASGGGLRPEWLLGGCSRDGLLSIAGV